MLATNLGYPRIGPDRELKRWVEAYWRGKLTGTQLEENAEKLRADLWKVQSQAGLDLVPCGDFTLYDHVLDTAVMLGVIPSRFDWEGGAIDLDLYFALARGKDDIAACEMTKWFDTNYHYLVPEFEREPRLTENRILNAYKSVRAAGIAARPVILGPFSFAALGRLTGTRLVDVLNQLTPLYARIVRELADAGATWIQIDEPCVVLDWSPADLEPLQSVCKELADAASPGKLALQTYFGDVADVFPLLLELPVGGLGLDFVRGHDANLHALSKYGFPEDKWLGIGIVDGRNVWRADLDAALGTIEEIAGTVPLDRTFIHPSCSLLHLPSSVAIERDLPDDLRGGIAFARERLDEVALLKRAINEGRERVASELSSARESRERFRKLQEPEPLVRQRLDDLTEADFRRPVAEERRAVQKQHLHLPPLPTTTIGSFPQTQEIRLARQRWQSGEISEKEYEDFLREEIARVIRLQEELGLDLLVHGESERSDMVEYFAEKLNGFAIARNGWVQSYGSRCVRPPLLYGDVSRPRPMTVDWAIYAQGLTNLPLKGMLTGPVTILNWSFVRDDVPRERVAYQLALAVRDEVCDLANAGLRVIQIDEPAIREGLPLRRLVRDEYLRWAVRAFRLATSGVDAGTQIHTHMCYSDFNDIIEAIDEMDADVISVEDARSGGELSEKLGQYGYSRGVGPGVYDVHSPQVPSVEAIVKQLRRTLAALRPDQVWVNPDCGLKTRGYTETEAALRNLVAAARMAREELGNRRP